MIVIFSNVYLDLVIADRGRLVNEVKEKDTRIKALEKNIRGLQAKHGGYDELKKQIEDLKGEKEQLKKRLLMFEKLQDASEGNLKPDDRNHVSSESGSRKISLPGKKEPWFN